VKREDFLNTKWDITGWTFSQRESWQKLMFSLGFHWGGGHREVYSTNPCFTSYCINEDGEIGSIGCDFGMRHFTLSTEKQMTYEDAFPSPTQHLEQQRAKARFDASIDATLAERGSRYGEFEDGAFIMQSLKGVMQSTDGWTRLSPPQREALEMIQHKIGRILNGDPNYADSWVDIAGYAKLISDSLDK
jgi:hypothetical protein